ncbi:MAG: hypothetical protein J6P56_05350 [Bacteroidales bacterium]|nr:hypothetical protein [Bacteroidales bacterium]
MKRAIIAIAAALLLAACSPQVYPLYLEVRQPSSSGFNLNRKSMSIVYMEGNNNLDSLFERRAASAMARSLEEDYFDGEEVVGLYSVPSLDTVTVENMRSLVMDTDKDVVFLLSTQMDVPQDTTVAMSIPLKARMYVYDSMGEDKVRSFKGSSVMNVARMQDLEEKADDVGKTISGRFLSGWKTESFSYYFFDDFSVDEWVEGIQFANDGAFAKSADVWMTLVKKGNNIKRACAAYNLAMTFYLMEDYEMSAKWLALAEKMEDLALAPGLRTRLNAYLEKTQ